MRNLRLLRAGDEPALERYLSAAPETSLLMRSNLRRAGVVDHGGDFEASYAAAWEGETIVAAVAHCWNGALLLEAPVELGALVRLALASSARAVSGLQGPVTQVAATRELLGLTDAPAATDSKDLLFALELASLRPQPPIPDAECRASTEADLPLLARWRLHFMHEALRLSEGPGRLDQARTDIERAHATGEVRLLLVGGRPVSYFSFTGRVPDSVLIGGVWTPAAERGRGYARGLIAAALEAERTRGVDRAVLFADPANLIAQRTYRSLGFIDRGDYGLVLFDQAAQVPAGRP